ncbi:MAG TPA: FHA domain-containing protein [Myxococcales bacterium]
MAIHNLLLLVRAYLAEPSALKKRCPHPVLVWEPPTRQPGHIETTDVSGLESNLAKGEPVAIEIVKGLVPNAFPFGVTIGHAENNDVVLHHHQVSRFHAYFQESNRKRFLVDANSRNGTWVGEEKLIPSKAFVLPSRATLRFGKLVVTFLEPDQLGTFLDERMKSDPPGSDDLSGSGSGPPA